jgi:AraC-like DNA-binding protein
MNLDRLPETVYFGRIRQPRQWNHGVWTLKYHLLLSAVSGQAIFTYSGRDNKILKGDWLFLPEGTEYSVSAQEPFEYYFIHFNLGCEPADSIPSPEPSDTTYNGFRLPKSDPHCVYLSDTMSLKTYSGELLAFLAQMQQHQLLVNAERKLLLDAQLTHLLIMLSIHNRKITLPVKTSAKLERILFYIQENFSDKITLASLSEHFELSKSYILRLFRDNLNTTVTAYINRYKLNYAAVLLKSTTQNVTEVAESLGFTDCYYFSRLFKRQFGESPMKYLKHYRLSF